MMPQIQPAYMALAGRVQVAPLTSQVRPPITHAATPSTAPTGKQIDSSTRLRTPNVSTSGPRCGSHSRAAAGSWIVSPGRPSRPRPRSASPSSKHAVVAAARVGVDLPATGRALLQSPRRPSGRGGAAASG